MTGLNSNLVQLAQGHSQLDLKIFRVEDNTLPGKPTEVPEHSHPEQGLPLLQVCT